MKVERKGWEILNTDGTGTTVFVDHEYEKVMRTVKKNKEKLRDYILTDYPGIILRSYYPSQAELYMTRGIHMKPFHPERYLDHMPPKKEVRKRPIKMKTLSFGGYFGE